MREGIREVKVAETSEPLRIMMREVGGRPYLSFSMGMDHCGFYVNEKTIEDIIEALGGKSGRNKGTKSK